MEWIDTDEGVLVLLERAEVEALAEEASDGLRNKLTELARTAKNDTIWIYPDGDTDRELRRLLRRLERRAAKAAAKAGQEVLD